MRAIKIDSENKIISEIEINDDYKDFQKIVGGTFAIGFYFPDDRHCCLINDEGLLNNPKYFFKYDLYPMPLAGNALIIGTGKKTGNTIPCRLRLNEIKDRVQFLSLVDVQGLIRKGEANYNTYFTSESGTELINTIDLGAFDQSDD